MLYDKILCSTVVTRMFYQCSVMYQLKKLQVQSEIMANKENIKEKYMDICIEQLKGLSLQR